MNNDFDSNNQFELTLELLQLLRWLAHNERNALKKIIAKALKHGLKYRIREPEHDALIQDTLHNGVVDFFNTVDDLLVELLADHEAENKILQQLIPTVKQLDAAVCDDETVQSSIENTALKLEHHPEQNPQDTLYKELLKQWKPHKKTALN
jgi:hypothetical protein